MSRTPDLQLRTLFILDERGRIVSTRERQPTSGPRFMLIRGTSSCAWAVRADVPAELAAELERLAGEESRSRDLRDEPGHAREYLKLLGGRINSGPAFSFPDEIADPGDVAIVTELAPLERNFRGWVAHEISERSPIVAVMDAGHPASICFCARNTEEACEAGVETAAAWRGREFAPRVTAAWALRIRASGRIPLYSTSWNNSASLAVARRLRLVQYAIDWSVAPEI